MNVENHKGSNKQKLQPEHEAVTAKSSMNITIRNGIADTLFFLGAGYNLIPLILQLR